MAPCLVAPSSFMRIKVLKRFFKRWKTSFMQEMEMKKEEKKVQKMTYQELAVKLMMVIDLKCFTGKIFSIKCFFERHLPKL